jgi:hypothetical protein
MGDVQKAGLVETRRVRIYIMDRRGLERSSCECFATVRATFVRLLSEMLPASYGQRPLSVFGTLLATPLGLRPLRCTICTERAPGLCRRSGNWTVHDVTVFSPYHMCGHRRHSYHVTRLVASYSRAAIGRTSVLSHSGHRRSLGIYGMRSRKPITGDHPTAVPK